MKKNSIRMRQIHRDCWDLDASFIKWLNEHLVVYLHDASKIIDLSGNVTCTFGDSEEEKSLEEWIKELISLTESMKGGILSCGSGTANEYMEEYNEYMEKWTRTLLIFNSIIFDLWW